jgi:hypothetical protein
MPSVSKAQQRFMGMVHAAQKGDMENPSPEVAKAADSMSDKDAKDFASTKHKGLPNKVKKESIIKLKEIIKGMIDEMNVTGNVQGYNTPGAFTKKGSEKSKNKKLTKVSTGYTQVNENRWIELKKEDSPAYVKVNKGISNINKQLAEIEKFMGWYGRIKQENGVSNQNFWKRTNKHIYTIKERLLKLEQQIRKIAQ